MIGVIHEFTITFFNYINFYMVFNKKHEKSKIVLVNGLYLWASLKP